MQKTYYTLNIPVLYRIISYYIYRIIPYHVFGHLAAAMGERFAWRVHNMDQATLFNKHSEHPHALPPSGLFVLGSISNG